MLLHCLMQVCMGRGRGREEGGREGERDERRLYFYIHVCIQFL